jgi:hypothetical protein
MDGVKMACPFGCLIIVIIFQTGISTIIVATRF